jgi:hypothetical protein
MTDPQRTILYIAGAGRSGSTLIEMILGNLPGFFSVGEIRFFWEYITRPDVFCGCGEALDACPFWAPVATELSVGHGLDLQEMAHLATKLDRTRQTLLMNSPLDINEHTRKPLTSGLAQLYDLVFERSGAQVIVDSSKTPTHLRLLRETGINDIRILHLIRDGRAVAYSWSKRVKRELARDNTQARMPSHSPLHSILVWMFENAGAARLSHDFPYSAMRYEDFAQNPKVELGKALVVLGLPADLSLLDQAPLQLVSTHSVGGNPVRFSPRGFQIKLDQEWRHGLSKPTYAALSVLGFPMLRSYGYIGQS